MTDALFLQYKSKADATPSNNVKAGVALTLTDMTVF